VQDEYGCVKWDGKDQGLLYIMILVHTSLYKSMRNTKKLLISINFMASLHAQTTRFSPISLSARTDPISLTKS